MGIEGLLKELGPLSRPLHIGECARGRRVGIDASCWLHRSAHACIRELTLGIPSLAWLRFCLRLLRRLQQHEVQPIVVFDGCSQPAKAKEGQRRSAQREANRQRALQLWENGEDEKAQQVAKGAVHVSSEMVQTFAAALRRLQIPFVVAPYEADAQLAFMALNKQIDLIITEDSDLLVFAPVPIFYKMNADGYGFNLGWDHLQDYRREAPGPNTLPDGSPHPLYPEISAPQHAFLKTLRRFTREQFVLTCVLAGCDYCDSLPGMGLKTALKLVDKYRGNLDRILALLKSPHSSHRPIPEAFEQDFRRALATFAHQTVFDQAKAVLVPLTPFPAAPACPESPDKAPAEGPSPREGEQEQEQQWFGPPLPPDIAVGLCEGRLSPDDLQPYPELSPWVLQELDRLLRAHDSRFSRASSSSAASSPVSPGAGALRRAVSSPSPHQRAHAALQDVLKRNKVGANAQPNLIGTLFAQHHRGPDGLPAVSPSVLGKRGAFSAAGTPGSSASASPALKRSKSAAAAGAPASALSSTHPAKPRSSPFEIAAKRRGQAHASVVLDSLVDSLAPLAGVQRAPAVRSAQQFLSGLSAASGSRDWEAADDHHGGGGNDQDSRPLNMFAAAPEPPPPSSAAAAVDPSSVFSVFAGGR